MQTYAARLEPTTTHMPMARSAVSPPISESELGKALSGSVMPKLRVGAINAPAEIEADRVADQIMRMPAPQSTSPSVGPHNGQGATIHRKCAACEDDIQRKPANDSLIRLKENSANAPKVSPAAESAVNSLGGGAPLLASERAFFEPRFGRDLSHVRIHTGAAADTASRSINARAFTLGNDIAFARGQYNPGSSSGRHLMAHELTHTMQQGNDATSANTLRRDLAIEPPNPNAVARVLTAQQRRAAMRFNQRRFEDPFTIRIIRDVFGGISDVPATIDDDFINATLQWQAERNLHQDGKFGAVTTRTMVRELIAEGEGRLARLLRSDNFVRLANIGGPTFFPPPNPARDFIGFRWDVAFRTSLRNGFIVQRIQNVWNEVGTPVPARIPAPTTPRYWEAWGVDGTGTITHPQHPTGADDRFQRAMHSGTRGNWRMTATLYTVLNLPGAFAAQGAANHPPDAGGLQATINNPGSDNLGLPEGFIVIQRNEINRTIAGRWDVTAANPAVHVNQRV